MAMSKTWKLTAAALVFAAASMASSAFAQGYPPGGEVNDFAVGPAPPYGWYDAPIAGGSIGYNENLRKDEW
jgi:hypothetical protein